MVQEAGIEQLEHQKKVLHGRYNSFSKENAGLEIKIGEEEENAWTMLAQFSSYRKKMAGHRQAVLQAGSQTGAQKILKEKRAVVRKLKEKREELRQDLEHPNGSTVEKAKVEKGSSIGDPCLDVQILLLFMFPVVR